jgi:hypothetical protein
LTTKPPSVDREKVPSDWKPGRVRSMVRAVSGPIAGARMLPIVLGTVTGVGAAAESRSRGEAWPLAVMQGVGTFLGILGAFTGRRKVR